MVFKVLQKHTNFCSVNGWGAHIHLMISVLYGILGLKAGEMAEWPNAPVLKTGVPQGTGGSNPSLSAKN